MRFSDSRPLIVAEPLGRPGRGVKAASSDRAGRSGRAFLEAVRGEVPSSMVGALVLAGGNDWRSIALRRAQSHLRLDRLPSWWSHAAFLLDWNADDPAASWGVEVTLQPESPESHRPEHNAVTRFRLASFLDEQRFPNLALVPIEHDSRSGERAEALRAMHEAALEPHRRGLRYPLWDWTATWLRYLYAGDAVSNPLREGVPMPGAALVELVLEACGVAAAPGATELNLCPELLWATVRHWHDRVSTEQGVAIRRAWQCVRDPSGVVAPSLSSRIEPLPGPPPPVTGGAARRPRR